jgi:thiol-disulfide isomerase/thioredoxin
MPQRLRRAALILALFIAAGVGLVWAVRYTNRVNAGLKAPAHGTLKPQFLKNPVPLPDLVLRGLDGQIHTPQTWRGKVAIVNFWASWCHPCRIEIPDLITLKSRFGDRLVVIGISAEIPGEDLSNDSRSTNIAAGYAREHGFNYPVVMQTTRSMEVFTGIYGLPTTFVIDTQGRIVQKHMGLTSLIVFDQEIRSLLGMPAEAVTEVIH